MRVTVEFKHQNEAQLRAEFRARTHPIIRAITWDLAFWLLVNYYTTLLITCLCRSLSNNELVGGSPTSRHLERPTKAIDYRTRDWPKGVVESAVQYLKDTWGDLIWVNPEKTHLHIQLSRSKFPDGSLK